MTDRGVEAAGRATVGVGARGLVFREKELERLSAALQTAREGGSDVILIGGPTGIGKTALVERMRASAIDFSVLELQGVEEECEIAFAGLFELLAPVLDLRAGLPEPQREALEGALALAPAAGSDQFAVLAATLGLLANAAEAGPLLVIVEDLQWVDEASVSAILFAMRRLGADGIAAVITRRNDEESGHDPRGLDELELRPLPPAEGEVLLRTLASVQVAPDVATAVVTEASGNPMLIAHAAELLSPEQLAGHELLPEPLPISEVMAATIERRAADLGEDAMRALTLVAAAGADRRLEVLAAALTDIDLDVAILEEADEAGHIRIEVERVEFNDPLLRSTVYQRASARDRRLAHAALARALPGSEMAERTAWHLAKATIGPDEQTAAALADAGRSAADRGGHAAAAKALERAAALTTTPALRGERLVMAAREANLAGRPSGRLS